MELCEFFTQHPRAALAFSGGVDSSYLLWAALDAGAEIRPYFVKTPFQPQFELEDAKRLCRELGVSLTVLPMELPAAVLKNSKDRCYQCKHALFGRLWEQVQTDGFSLLLDGTNASDDPADRPGMRALGELSVLSPLRLCGVTKAQVREQSKKAGLFTWDKPAYACLATRFPTGMQITEQGLLKIEQAEDLLFHLGFTDFRVRFYGEAARIQIPVDQMDRLIARREEILSALAPRFQGVCLDLEGRP